MTGVELCSSCGNLLKRDLIIKSVKIKTICPVCENESIEEEERIVRGDEEW